jgi:hypothetical protein
LAYDAMGHEREFGSHLLAETAANNIRRAGSAMLSQKGICGDRKKEHLPRRHRGADSGETRVAEASIKIGMIAEQTGALSFMGRANANVAKRVVDNLNGKGGILGGAAGPGGLAEMVPGQHHVRMSMYIAQAKNGRFEIVKELGALDPQEPVVKGERTSAKRG